MINVETIPTFTQIVYDIAKNATVLELKRLIAKKGFRTKVRNCNLWSEGINDGKNLKNESNVIEIGLVQGCNVNLLDTEADLKPRIPWKDGKLGPDPEI